MRFLFRAGTCFSDVCRDFPRRREPQSGFAYLFALFLIMMMITASSVVLMDMRTQGRRQREDDMIWRGKQFVQAIKHYYRRTGHYPQNLDDLQKGIANIHFLRQEALVDPMNSSGDGKWRFIYTNPAGQILGSTRYATMQQMAILDMNGGKPPHMPDSDSDEGSDQSSDCTQPATGTANPPPSQFSAQPIGSAPGAGMGPTNFLTQVQTMMSPGQAAPQAGAGPTPATSGQTGTSTATCGVPGALGLSAEALKGLMDLKPTGPVDSPVIGGFLVGVGSTVDRTSVRVYKGGKKYNEWEFIWNPLEEQALAIQQGINQTGGLGGLGQGIGLAGPGTTSSGEIGSSPIQAPPTPQPPQPSQPQPPQ